MNPNMRIIKATDPIPVDHPVFLIFGQPGIGKTSLGYSADDPLLVDADKGAHRAVNRRDTLAVDTWPEIDAATAGVAGYKTIVPDTVGRVVDLMAVDLIAGDPKLGRGGSLTLPGYGSLKARFQNWTTRLRANGLDLVMLAHQKEDKDGDSIIVRPDIMGGSYAEVMKIADFVGFLYMHGRDRVLDFNPTDRWVGKNPAGWKPMVVPQPEKATTFLADLLARGRDALGAISEESARITELVDTWRTQIENLTTPEDCTGAIAAVNKLEPVAMTQVKALLAARAKALGFEFDRAARKFISKAPVVDRTPAASELGF